VVPVLPLNARRKCNSNRSNNPGNLNPVEIMANVEMVLVMGEAMVVAGVKINIDQ
jgi:hypothetical protein